VHEASVRVTAAACELDYDLRWYDDRESIVPLWWLGVWERATDDLVHTEVLDGPCSVSPRDLFAWLAGAAPEPVAAHLVGQAARAVGVGPSLVP
jgi:hypothetical protein